MKRDMDLVQKILEHVEEHVTPHGRPSSASDSKFPVTRTRPSPTTSICARPRDSFCGTVSSVEGLSWDGHTLLDALRLASEEDAPNG